MKERGYIFCRKAKAFGNKLCFVMNRIFSIKQNRVAICTFEGRGGFGCNPKYIVEELHRRNKKYEFIWFVNDMNKEFPDYIKKVPNTLWNRAYWLTTSKIWIDNYRKPYGTCKRIGQFYINTWHGTLGFKRIGLWRGSAFSEMAYLVSKADSELVDYMVIDSSWCEKVFPKGLVYNGEFLKTGMPRCDILFGNKANERNSFREKNGIDLSTKIIMFAPTFREKSVDGVRKVFSEIWTIDFNRLLNVLENKFGGNWMLCIRLHPQVANELVDIVDELLKGKIIDVSKAEDMYEILAAVDILITDYSSVAMDACLMEMPVFLYADDIDEYVRDRGNLWWDMSKRTTGKVPNFKEVTPELELELPFTIAENNDELEKNILEFDYKDYQAKVREMNNLIGVIFDGQASKRVADQIESMLM